MTWKTPLVKASADLLSHRSGIVSHLLRNEHVASAVVADDNALVRAMFGKGGPWRKVLDSPVLRTQLGFDKDAVAWVDPLEVMARLSKDELLHLLDALEHRKLIGLADLLDHFGSGLFLEKMGPDQILASLSPEQIFEGLGRDRALDHVGRDEIIRHLGPVAMLDALTPEQMIAYLGPEKMLEHLGPEKLLAHLDPGAMLEYLDADDMLKRLGWDRMFEHLGAGKMMQRLGSAAMMKHIGPEKMIESVGLERAVEHFGEEKLLERVGHKRMLDYLSAASEDFDADGKRTAAHIAANPAAVDALAANDEAMNQILVSEEARKKMRVLDGLSWTGRLSYALPAAVVSFPRSGSNFLQSILTHSTGTNNMPIDMQKPLTQVPLLTVKSHAPSPGYLLDEFQRLLSIDRGPGRIVLIKRDPRDVMVSFYEYAQAQRDTKIDQKDFLENICFFYASAIDKTHGRRVDNAPMSVVQAYTKHVRTWFAERPAALPVIEVSYEDLVAEPRETFGAVFDFLALDAPVAEGFLDLRVSQYSEERRLRGMVQSWRNYREEYSVLLDKIERLLGGEIELLGYGARPATPAGNAPDRAAKPGRASNRKSTPKKKSGPQARKKKNASTPEAP